MLAIDSDPLLKTSHWPFLPDDATIVSIYSPQKVLLGQDDIRFPCPMEQFIIAEISLAEEERNRIYIKVIISNIVDGSLDKLF